MDKINKLYLTNIFIIDWDDTLFPTTWVNSNKININNIDSINKYKLYFLELDETMHNLLKELNIIGDVYIVTNANIQWIRSCLGVLNKTRGIIIKNNIRIVSARDLYSNSPKKLSPTDWKILTFQDILEDILLNISSKLKTNTFLNVISLGDANYEYMALINLDNYFKKNSKSVNYLLKSVKFIEKPQFDSIIDQLTMVIKNIQPITNKIGYLDLKFKE